MSVSNCPRCNEAVRIPSGELPEDGLPEAVGAEVRGMELAQEAPPVQDAGPQGLLGAGCAQPVGYAAKLDRLNA